MNTFSERLLWPPNFTVCLFDSIYPEVKTHPYLFQTSLVWILLSETEGCISDTVNALYSNPQASLMSFLWDAVSTSQIEEASQVLVKDSELCCVKYKQGR